MQAIHELQPDLLLLDMGAHLDTLGITADEALAHTPCSLALLAARSAAAAADLANVQPIEVKRILLAFRGGPNTNLAVRLNISLPRAAHTALHRPRPAT